MPRRQVDAFFQALAVKPRHDKTVDGHERQIVRIEKVLQARDPVAVLLQFVDDALRKAQFDRKHFVRECNFLDLQDIALEARPEVVERFVRKNV